MINYRIMEHIVHYLDGKWIGEKGATLSIFDLSVIRGFGVFDFLRTYDRKPFMLDSHIDRLFNSAKRLGIIMPESKTRIRQIVFTGIEKNNLPDYNLRIVVTDGVSQDGISPSDN